MQARDRCWLTNHDQRFCKANRHQYCSTWSRYSCPNVDRWAQKLPNESEISDDRFKYAFSTMGSQWVRYSQISQIFSDELRQTVSMRRKGAARLKDCHISHARASDHDLSIVHKFCRNLMHFVALICMFEFVWFGSIFEWLVLQYPIFNRYSVRYWNFHISILHKNLHDFAKPNQLKSNSIWSEKCGEWWKNNCSMSLVNMSNQHPTLPNTTKHYTHSKYYSYGFCLRCVILIPKFDKLFHMPHSL